MDGNDHRPEDDQIVQNALMESQDKLYALIRMLMIRNAQDALDVLQNTNAAILEHFEQYDPSKPAWPWFRMVALNQVKMYFRGKARSPMTFDSDLMDRLAGDVEEGRLFHGIELDEYLDALRRCMGKLPPLKKELLKERYMDGEEVVKLAAKYHVTLASLTQLFYRLRGALQNCIRSAIAKRVQRGGLSADGGSHDAEKDSFAERLDLLLDDRLSEADTFALEEEIASSPEKRLCYMEQAFLHVFLQCRKNNLFADGAAARPVYRVPARAALIAAAWAALLTGGALLLRRGEPRRLPPVAETRRVPVAAEGGRTQPKAIEKAAPAPQAAIAAAKPAPVPVFVETKPQPAVEKPPQKEEEKPMNIASIKSSVATTAAVATAALLTSAQKAALAASESNVPVVSNVTLRQPFGTRMLEIGYTLANGPGIVTVDITTNGVSIGDANTTFMSGEVNKVVQNGSYTVLWDTKHGWPNHTNEQARAVVTAWATNCPPDYLVADLLQGTNIQYYVSAAALPDGGLTNAAYRTTRIVMRRIPAAGVTWAMGTLAGTGADMQHAVTNAEDYYIGIYPVTQGQWAVLKKTWPSHFSNLGDRPGRPVEQISYNAIRDSSDNNAGSTAYPSAPASDSFLGLLRAKTGVAFDLPSEAQWEYACRAGHEDGKWGDGSGWTSVVQDANLDSLGRYQYNGGLIDGTTVPAAACGTVNGTAVVGSYRPNSWGVYDMHGNVWEWCLDWYKADITGLNGSVVAVDGDGSSVRVLRGGSWDYYALSSRSNSRSRYAPGSPFYNAGFRIAAPAVAVGQ